MFSAEDALARCTRRDELERVLRQGT